MDVKIALQLFSATVQNKRAPDNELNEPTPPVSWCIVNNKGNAKAFFALSSELEVLHALNKRIL